MFLTISVLAGDMPGPGFVQNPPNTPSAAAGSIGDQPVVCAAQTNTNTTCDEATPDPVNEAMVIAIQLLTSVW